jgi:hypothetical protein
MRRSWLLEHDKPPGWLKTELWKLRWQLGELRKHDTWGFFFFFLAIGIVAVVGLSAILVLLSGV